MPDGVRLQVVAGGRAVEIVALVIEPERVERHRRRLEVRFEVQRAH